MVIRVDSEIDDVCKRYVFLRSVHFRNRVIRKFGVYHINSANLNHVRKRFVIGCVNQIDIVKLCFSVIIAFIRNESKAVFAVDYVSTAADRRNCSVV